MKIRPKVIAWIAAILAVVGLAEVLVVRQIVMPSFSELERADARTAMRRIQYAFELTLDRLEVLAIDWGNWALVYRFMNDRQAAVLGADITDSNIREIDVNLVLIVDPDGRVVYARTVDLPAEKTLDLAALPALPPTFPWRADLRAGHSMKGLLRTNLGTLMLAGGPILDGDGHGPHRGSMILGRLLKSMEISRIAAQAQATLALLPAPPARRPDRLSQDAKVTHVDRDFVDIFGRPILTLRVEVPRAITAYGRNAVAYASVSLIAGAILVVVLLVWMISRVILNPLAIVTHHAVVVGEDKDLTIRLGLDRHDEIGVLAREFDRMVERVAESRTQLVDQSFESGFSELAKEMLHNLGNAITPIGVRAGGLAARLRDAPGELAVEAATELQEGVPDQQRRSDLQEFLRLACAQLAESIRSAEHDLTAITQQVSTINAMLAEHMRSARNEHVIEVVRLTELVAQATEVVPAAHRQRLAVHADESVRGAGAVRLARTIVRRVLREIIIHAADALLNAGRDHGVLHVRAEVVHEAGNSHLHICCEDDGVGIAAEKLERLFEKDHSMPTREGSHVADLHWCANAITALGGRIWALSDGPGRGASVHLVVPLTRAEAAVFAGAA
ncbi:MAG: HAMP domain-containing protein [Proteobacteria bacterium]|nr:HAMP domain-containing protein [Pseudomonadota bacterium]